MKRFILFLAWLMLVFVSCSIFSAPSKPEIIVELEEMPVVGEFPFAISPQWGPDGNIYFVCWTISHDTCDEAICVTDPEGENVERIEGVYADSRLAVAPEGNRMAYWDDYDKIVITDLDGNLVDSIESQSFGGRFSTVSDTLFYLDVPYEGIRRYNLNTGEYELILALDYDYTQTPFSLPFDLFPQDSAILVGDTIFSLTTKQKTTMPILDFDYDYYEDCSINPANPRYVALSELYKVTGEDTSGYTPGGPSVSEVMDGIIIVDILDGAYNVLTTTPRSTKKREYSYAGYPEFSPDGNSIVYSVFRDGDREGEELAIITDVLED